MSTATARRIKVRCQCGAKLAAKASPAEHTLPCPRCQQPVKIPAAEPEPEPEEPTATGCPLCKHTLVNGGPLCVHCGYHTELRRKLSTTPSKIEETDQKLPAGLWLKSSNAYPWTLIGVALSIGFLWNFVLPVFSYESSFEMGLLGAGLFFFVLRLATQLFDEENILGHVLVACFAGIGVVGVLTMVNAGSDFESMFDALFLTVVGMIFIYRGGYSLVDDTD